MAFESDDECDLPSDDVLDALDCEPARTATLFRPGHGLISRVLVRELLVRGVLKRDEHLASDLFSDARDDIVKRFHDICLKFRKSGNEQSLKCFENFLRRAVINSLKDQMKKANTAKNRNSLPGLPRNPFNPGEPSTAEETESIECSRQVQAWMETAVMSRLTPQQRTVLVDYEVHSVPLEEIARGLGTCPNNLYKTVCVARLVVKMYVIEQTVLVRFQREPKAEAAFRPLVAARCQSRHECFMYQVICRKARQLDDLVEMISRITKDGASAERNPLHGAATVTSQPQDAAVMARRLSDFEDFVYDSIDDWDLYEALDRCSWTY